MNTVAVRDDVAFGGEALGLIAGPCVIEGLDRTLRIAETLVALAADLGLPFVFKSSFDKANRSSVDSFRGPGLGEGLAVLAKVKDATGAAVTTDVHEPGQCAAVAEVADLLQVPAFLCRQTDLLLAAAATGRAVSVKKGQFMAPGDMSNVVGKLRHGGAAGILLMERGTTFGYHNLVVDLRGLVAMRELGWPVVFDGTHSVQRPAAEGGRSGGDRDLIAPLVRGAVAVGVDALFLECHDDPDRALCDGPNMLPLSDVRPLLETALRLREAAR